MPRLSLPVLLDGQRFRGVCMAVAGGISDEVSGIVWQIAHEVSDASVLRGTFSIPPRDLKRLARALETLPLDDVRSWSDPLLFFRALTASVDAAMPWQPPCVSDALTADASVREALVPVAAAISAAPGTAWWASDVDMTNRWVTTPVREGRVVPNSSPGPMTRVLDEWSVNHDRENVDLKRPKDRASRTISGSWWSTPHTYGEAQGDWARPPSSTRRIGDLGAVSLMLVEDSFGDGEALLQRLTMSPHPRVFEIHSIEDWAALVARYPRDARWARRGAWWGSTGLDEKWFIPDYREVAQDFDGIHVSVQGYLAVAGEVVEVPGGATVLAGWSPDETFWLTDEIVIDGDTEEWRFDDDDNVSGWRHNRL